MRFDRPVLQTLRSQVGLILLPTSCTYGAELPPGHTITSCDSMTKGLRFRVEPGMTL